MSPKLPRRSHTTTLDLPHIEFPPLSVTPPPIRPDGTSSVELSPTRTGQRRPSVDPSGNSPDAKRPRESALSPSIKPSPLPPLSRVTSTPIAGRSDSTPRTLTLDAYVVSVPRLLPAPDAQGLRHFAGRTYADLENGSTVQVMFDAATARSRAKLASELDASGPWLERTETGVTWRDPTALGRHIDFAVNDWLKSLTGTATATRPSSLPVGPARPASPQRLPLWSDQEIQKLYGLEGEAISRFRREVQNTGKKPVWVDSGASFNTDRRGPVEQIVDESLKWQYPEKSREERLELLQSYNLLPSDLPRLRQELEHSAAFGQWAEARKISAMDPLNLHRFDGIRGEVEPKVVLLRRNEDLQTYPGLLDTYSSEYVNQFLLSIGYQRNAHQCLYRTDIPAMFRSEDRTPFELTRDSGMLAREGHTPGTTTGVALSASFGLSDAANYSVGGGPGIGQLRYNTQRNKYPGRKPQGESDSDSSSSGADSDSDTGSALSMDSERGYESLRLNQQQSFVYLIDTRHVEVVPGHENHVLNKGPRTEDTWFPTDDIEGHISVSRGGISDERIWLVNSQKTRAAKVADISAKAGDDVEDIESRTWEGNLRGNEYDRLIDRVAEGGGTVLELPVGRSLFSDDIVWP